MSWLSAISFSSEGSGMANSFRVTHDLLLRK
jgi:hypothetical protein